MKFTMSLLMATFFLTPHIANAGARSSIQGKVSFLGENSASGSMAGIRNSDNDQSHVTVLNGVYYSSVFIVNGYGIMRSCTTTRPVHLELLRAASDSVSIEFNNEGECISVGIHSDSMFEPKQ